ncbi:TIGR04133 family radical SAM/SPASM protein [uncultured Alistipes sp.]|uniref:TIGR04133 family radical SAM/SPASM protein n=1 Tax=uncultured Alistipes sp. TaxID=538949 RepID=UPI0025DE09C1|nr:TIGR04133 family radical SAM/SPASM protein [uncultured Alistipes sp.]
MNRSLGLRQRLALEVFRKIQDLRIERHELRTLFWECTLRCNLACRHCGSDCRTEASQPDMPAEDFFRVLDTQITPHVDPHRVLVILSGGEVLMRPDLERIGLELYRREYPWGMVTNGLALDARRFEALLRAGLHTITVSLDGFADDHLYIRRNPRSFERASDAVRMIAADGSLAWDVVTCVTPRSLPRLNEFKEYLISLGVKAWRLFTIFPSGRASEEPGLQLDDAEFVRLLDFIRDTRREGRIRAAYACEGFLGGYEGEVRDTLYNCTAGVSTASIRIDGAISGCTSIRSDFHQGNIYRDDFHEVWEHRFEKFRNRAWTRKDQCADCAMFRYCRGGGMHLYDGDGRLKSCRYARLRSSK